MEFMTLHPHPPLAPLPFTHAKNNYVSSKSSAPFRGTFNCLWPKDSNGDIRKICRRRQDTRRSAQLKVVKMRELHAGTAVKMGGAPFSWGAGCVEGSGWNKSFSPHVPYKFIGLDKSCTSEGTVGSSINLGVNESDFRLKIIEIFKHIPKIMVKNNIKV